MNATCLLAAACQVCIVICLLSQGMNTVLKEVSIVLEEPCFYYRKDTCTVWKKVSIVGRSSLYMASFSLSPSLYSSPPHAVDCNDSLYAGDRKLVIEVAKLVHTLLEQVMEHMKELGPSIEVCMYLLHV